MKKTNRILVLTGRGRFEDQWHDVAATSHALAEILQSADNTVTVRSTFLNSLDDVADFDLVVLNISGPVPGFVAAGIDEPTEQWATWVHRLYDWVSAGGRVFALHQSLLAAAEFPELEQIIGGKWVNGVSGHPPIGPMQMEIDSAQGGHPLFAYLSGVGVTAYDERYCQLTMADNLEILGYVRDDDGNPQPALWVCDTGKGRTVYYSLGHDSRSYDSPTSRKLLTNAATWLLTQK